MAPNLKVAVIGGGSTYTPELVSGFLARIEQFPLTELWLMDILPERLDVVGSFARRIVKAAGAPFEIHLTTDQRAAVRGAAYVTTQLRVGWMQARRADEYLGRRHGLIGQETTGIGGMAKALRTIPVVLQIAQDMAELAPGALLVNFTNPAGLIVEALARYAPEVSAVGLCNMPINMEMNVIKRLNERLGRSVTRAQCALDTLGLNHLTWHRGFRVDGDDVWPQIIADYAAELKHTPGKAWKAALVENLRMVPNDYLYYYYATAEKRAAQDAWPPSRAEKVMSIEKNLLAEYAEPDRTTPPDDLMERGGAYYSTVATQLLSAHYNDLGETHIVNTRHGGAVPGWPADWVLEMPCKVNRTGISPIPTAPLPPVCFGLLAQVKMYEILTVEAAVHGDRAAAYQALLAHPLGPAAEQIPTVLDDLIETHKAYLPQFA